jgi:hypothetical protein
MAERPQDLIPEEPVERIMRAPDDPAALALEAQFLLLTDNGRDPDPEDLPPSKSGHAAAVAPVRAAASEPPGGTGEAAKVIGIAASEVGTEEAPVNKTKYGQWYGADGQAWCAMYLSWCFNEAGFPQPASTSKGFAFTPAGAAWYQQQGRWGTVPKVGSVVFFKFPGGPNRIHHVGLVTGIDGSVVETIEGNTSSGAAGSQREGGGVYRRRRSIGMVGYGYPAYSGASVPDPGGSAAPGSSGDQVVRIKELQTLLGVTADGDFGSNSKAACSEHPIGFQSEVDRKNASHPHMENRSDLVHFIKRQLNRRFGYGLDEQSDAVGAQVNHGIVVGLGQADSICGPAGYLNATL